MTMTNKKISALTAASVPLVGTETFPLVQSGATVNITRDQLFTPAAAKGINFTANTPAAGMTSQLLNWYEEGTFTIPQVSSGSYTARYTRIGRVVVIEVVISSFTLSSATLTTLPFVPGVTAALSIYTDGVAPGAGLVLQATVAGTSIYLRTYDQTTGAFATLTDLTGITLRITGMYSI